MLQMFDLAGNVTIISNRNEFLLSTSLTSIWRLYKYSCAIEFTVKLVAYSIKIFYICTYIFL